MYFLWSLGQPWVLQFVQVLFILFILFPLFRHHKYLSHVSYHSMGILSFFFIFILMKDFLKIFSLIVEDQWVLASSLIMSLSATRNALKEPHIKKINLQIDDLPNELNGLRIVQLSDLHVGPTIGKKYIDNIVNIVNQLDADLVALTGDIGDGPVEKHRTSIESFKNLKSKLGVFFVPGNHEYYWNANEWMNAVNNLKVIVLLNRGKVLNLNNKKILIAGVSDPAGGITPDPAISLELDHHSDVKILLSHRPGLADEASKMGYHLQLSGHTHAGQFFPWTIIVRFFHKHFKGAYKINDMWLYVNQGTGSWGPMMRLGSQTEITLLEINSTKDIEK